VSKYATRTDDSWKWDAKPLRKDGGLMIAGRFYAWDKLGVTPNEEVGWQLATASRRAEREVEKQSRRQEAARQFPESPPRDAPRYFMTPAGWTWHVFDAQRGGFVDTGLRPGPRGVGYPPEEAA
jgi:hypothetical protein